MLSPSIERQRNDEGIFFKKMKKINTAKIPRVKHLKVVRQNKTSTVVLVVCQLTVYQVDRSERGFA